MKRPSSLLNRKFLLLLEKIRKYWSWGFGRKCWFREIDFMSIVLDLQSWAVLLLGITLLPLVQQVKHRLAAKLGRGEWFTALQ